MRPQTTFSFFIHIFHFFPILWWRFYLVVFPSLSSRLPPYRCFLLFTPSSSSLLPPRRSFLLAISYTFHFILNHSSLFWRKRYWPTDGPSDKLTCYRHTKPHLKRGITFKSRDNIITIYIVYSCSTFSRCKASNGGKTKKDTNVRMHTKSKRMEQENPGCSGFKDF